MNKQAKSFGLLEHINADDAFEASSDGRTDGGPLLTDWLTDWLTDL